MNVATTCWAPPSPSGSSSTSPGASTLVFLRTYSCVASQHANAALVCLFAVVFVALMFFMFYRSNLLRVGPAGSGSCLVYVDRLLSAEGISIYLSIIHPLIHPSIHLSIHPLGSLRQPLVSSPCFCFTLTLHSHGSCRNQPGFHTLGPLRCAGLSLEVFVFVL